MRTQLFLIAAAAGAAFLASPATARPHHGHGGVSISLGSGYYGGYGYPGYGYPAYGYAPVVGYVGPRYYGRSYLRPYGRYGSYYASRGHHRQRRHHGRH